MKIKSCLESLDKFKENVSRYGEELAADNLWSLWGFWIASAVVASLIAFLLYQAIIGAQEYTQFIAGSLSWRAARKSRDYYALFGIVVGFPAALVSLLFQANLIRKKIGASALRDFHALIVLGALPGVLWFGRLFLTKDASFYLLGFSSVLIFLVCLFSAIATLRVTAHETFFDSVSASTVSIVWGAFSGLALALIFNRLFLRVDLGRYLIKDFGFLFAGVFAVLSVPFIQLAWRRSAKNCEASRWEFRKLIILMQGLAPWFFLILLPTPWVDQGSRFYGYPMKNAAWIAVAVLIAIAYADLARRWKSGKHTSGGSIESAFSPVCLIGLLLFIKVQAIAGPTINPEDYHVGEFLLPYWSWAARHMIPYWDYSPARGLINYVPGFFSSVLFDGTAPTFAAVDPFSAALYLIICYPIVARSIGMFPAFLAFLVMPLANGLSEIDMVVTAALCVLCETYLRLSSAAWLAVWIGMGTVAVLIAPGQGGLLVLATIPLGLIATCKAFTLERKRLFISIGVLFAAVVPLLTFTQLGKMLVGAIRYGAEQSSVNTVANGVEWAASWKADNPVINKWLFEAVRSSWILVAIAAAILILRWAFGRKYETGKRAIVFAVPIFLFDDVLYRRAAGRIDSDWVSRLGIASIWALSLMLPLLLISAFGKNHRSFILVAWIFFAAIISPPFSSLDPDAVLKKVSTVIAAPAKIVHGKDLGLPNLGNGVAQAAHILRLETIKRVLDILVDPGETYLDMTNRNANYFYLEYEPPIEVGAVYNLVTEGQQYRAIRRLEKRPPPVVLASADSILHDGGTAAYRCHHLYRYIIDRYIPIRIDGFIYLVRPDRLSRVQALADTRDPLNSEYRALLLDSVFRMASIAQLPEAWGRSLGSLKSKMKLVKSFQDAPQPFLHSVRGDGSGGYVVEGPDPYIAFDIRDWKLDGASAGFLHL